jgi:hypothetical protein
MNRRLYFVLPDIETSRAVEQDLLLARIEDSRMHFLGPRDLDLGDLPEAGTGQKTDLWHGAMIGGLVGAAVGCGLGYVLWRFPNLLGMNIASTAVLLVGLLGLVFGVWCGGYLIGSSTPNTNLKEFEKVFEQGHILLMLDAPKERVDELRKLIKGHFPGAEDHGMSPTMPAFP